MITPAEIEAVARAACKEMGLDADERLTDGFGHPHPRWTYMGYDVCLYYRAIEAVKGAGK